ncbi:DUF748 domain-containing protein [Nafulsella turpanensis]|uniref:DUF748 domain-containing protein n=1 Tax=Nafulsella turpanensis TaxID=1265690 RepID=UPI0003460BDD|nr:DUF748 domain-containing protein [Nafulsella turpanensis]
MKKTFITLLIVVLVLAAIRIALPYIAEYYVNKVLDDMPGYSGEVEDVDMALYRGAYVIENLRLETTTETDSLSPAREQAPAEGEGPAEEVEEPPFLLVDEIDLSLEWNALFKGAIVGEAYIQNPTVNFVGAVGSQNQQDTTDQTQHWSEAVKKLMPITVNRLVINSGKISYKDFTTEPNVDVFLDSLYLRAENLKNVEDNNSELPAPFQISAETIGGGKLAVNGELDIIQEIPGMDVNFKLVGVDLTALNDFIKAYAGVDVEKGQFSVYSEYKLVDGRMEGYIKPFFDNLEVFEWEQDVEEQGFLKSLWEGISGLVSEVVENEPKDVIATKVPIDGTVDHTKIGVWTGVINILKNAFLDAFTRGLEGSIDYEGNLTRGFENTVSVEGNTDNELGNSPGAVEATEDSAGSQE